MLYEKGKGWNGMAEIEKREQRKRYAMQLVMNPVHMECDECNVCNVKS